MRLTCAERRILTVAALVVLALAVEVSSHAAASSPAGHWRGSGRLTRIADLKLASLIMSTQSDFWFTVNAGGIVDGYAVSSYQVVLNDGKLRSRLAAMNTSANFAVGLMPEIGELLGKGMATKDVVGMSAVCDEPMPVRFARIKGTLAGNTLHISWVEPPSKVGYKRYIVYATKEELQSESVMTAFGPWDGDAVVSEISPGEFEAMVNEARSQTAEGNAKISSVWTAYRVSSH
jgi:hypothetical protein